MKKIASSVFVIVLATSIGCNTEQKKSGGSIPDLSIKIENKMINEQSTDQLVYSIINNSGSSCDISNTEFKLQITSNPDGITEYVKFDLNGNSLKLTGNDTIKSNLDLNELIARSTHKIDGNCAVKVILEKVSPSGKKPIKPFESNMLEINLPDRKG